MKNLKLLSIAFFLGLSILGFSQAAYVLPSPTDANEEMTLYIDVSQTVDGTSNNALKAMLTEYPDEPVYLWAWQPAAPVAGNGDWGESNEDMLLEKIGDMLYSMTFVPSEFFGVDGPTFFANGISCLAKFKDGNSFPDDFEGEAKTEDLEVVIIPKLCDKRICVFPEIREHDDYISITYDNTQEEITELMNLGDEECYIYLGGQVSTFVSYPYVDASMVTSTPELQMKPVIGDPGKFRITLIPEDFFGDLLAEGEEVIKVQFYILKPGFQYSGAPPTETITLLICE